VQWQSKGEAAGSPKLYTSMTRCSCASAGRVDRAWEVILRPLEVTRWMGRDRGGGGGSPEKSRRRSDVRVRVQGLSWPYFRVRLSAGARQV
jgi:hypothetical protein